MGVQPSGSEPSPPLSSRLVASVRAHPNLSLALIVVAAAAAYLAATVVWPGRGARAVAVLDAVAAAVRDGDAQAVMEHVSPRFSSEGFSRDSLAEALTRALQGRPLGRVTVSVRDVQIEHGKATVKVHVSARRETHGYPGLNTSEWYVVMEDVNGRWLIVSAQPVHVAGRGVSGLGGVLRLGY
jgi:hypothetical protein